MPNARLTTDYVEGWTEGTKELHKNVMRDLLPVFRDLMAAYPEVTPALTGLYSLLYGMPLPAPARSENATD